MDEPLATALALHQAGRLTEAAPLYRMALRQRPANAVPRHLYGVLQHQEGNSAAGVRLVRQAMLLVPAEPAYSANLVTVLLGAGLASEAVRHGRRAVTLAPRAIDAAVNLASAELVAGQPGAAVERMTVLVARYPTDPALLNRLAVAQEAGRLWRAAERTRRRLLCIAPDQSDAYRMLADHLGVHGREGEARPLLKRATRIVPAFATALRSAMLADRVPSRVSDISEARERLERFLDQAEHAPRLPTIADPHHEIATTNFAFSYHALNNRDLFERVGRLLLRASPDLGWTAPHCRKPPARRRRIRIGLVTAHFGQHSIGKLYAQLLLRLPRDRFEVVAIARRPANDSAFALQTGWADSVVLLTGQLAHDRSRMAAVEADALFYLDIGMDPLTYYLAFARLAPVQFTTWGHPDTTGIPNVDYFVTAASAEPDDWRDHYSERALLLAETPMCFPRLPDLSARARRRPLDLPARARAYGCPQTLFKLHPSYDAVFGELLRRDSDGHLIFIESAAPAETARVRARFDKTCPDVADRIHIVPRMSGTAYLDFVGGCDVLLDCHAFSSGTSLFEALSMGTPSVPYNGRFARMRVTDSLLRTFGIDVGAPTDPENYVRHAIAVANDPSASRALIAERAPAAYERQSAVDQLCMAVERMVEAAGRGERLPPGLLS